MQAQPNAGAVPPAQGGGGGDALDKGLDKLATRMGHTQSRGTIEKVSDGLRKVFKKATGKDVPIKDQEYK